MSRKLIAPETTAEELRTSLEGSLRFIHEHYSGKDRQSARAMAIEVIDLLKQHLDKLGIEPSLTSPLDDIHMALAEAERGLADPLFEPEPLRGRARTGLWKLFVMIKASLAIDLLMKAGKSNEEAARYVAKWLQQHDVAIGGKSDVADWKTVRGWRQELSKTAKGSPKRITDWAFYGGMYQLEKEHILPRVKAKDIDPIEEAKRQLEAIPRSLSSVG